MLASYLVFTVTQVPVILPGPAFFFWGGGAAFLQFAKARGCVKAEDIMESAVDP